MATGRVPDAPRQFAGHRLHISREIERRIGAVGDPFGIAMPALIDGVGGPAGAGERFGGGAPGMAGLAAAMQQQYGRALVAEHVGCELVAGCCRETSRLAGVGCLVMVARSEIRSPPLLNTLSPTASIWSRPGMSTARASGISAASLSAGPAMSSLLPTAISTGMRICATCSRVSVWREPRMQAASARRSDFVCSAKARNMRPVRIGNVGERRRLQCKRNVFRQAGAVHELVAEPAENGRARTRSGCVERKKGGVARAHRITHHVGAIDRQVIEQRAHVLGHDARSDSRPDHRACRIARARDCRARSRAGRRRVSARSSRAAPS